MKPWLKSFGLLQIFGSLLLVTLVMFLSTYYIYHNSRLGIYEKTTQNNNLAPTLEQAYVVHELVDCIYASAQNGAAVPYTPLTIR